MDQSDEMEVDNQDPMRPRSESNGSNNDQRIVADLMRYSVLPESAPNINDTRSFQETAIRSLVRRLRRAQERNALQNLIRAVETHDRETACIRIPRSLDGRMQVRQKKTIPHVLYCQIWRWNDLKTYHELQGIVTCRYAYDMSQSSGEICVNPYHYERIANTIQRRRFNEWREDGYQFHPDQTTIGFGPGDESYNQRPPQRGIAAHMGPAHNDRDIYVAPNSEATNDYIEVPNSFGSSDSNVIILPLEEVSPSGVPITSSQESSFQQPWARLMYYELKDRCGDFEVHSNELQIDNGTHPFLLNRFCLGRMTNIKRTEQIEKIRCALGRGVKLTGGCGNADVFLENLSQSKVFVQSSIWNASEERDLATIQSIQPNQRQKIFNKIKFSLKLQEWTNSNDYNRVAQMVNDCKIRVSFVKGWGSNYSRTHIDSCECWFEIQLLECLSWLDHVLSNMAPPVQISSGSVHPSATEQASKQQQQTTENTPSLKSENVDINLSVTMVKFQPAQQSKPKTDQ